MRLTVEINSCDDCRHISHSGAFTPGGAKLVCGYPGIVDIVGQFKKIEEPKNYIRHLNDRKSPLHKKACDYVHWRHRVIKDPKKIPAWCPLKLGHKY